MTAPLDEKGLKCVRCNGGGEILSNELSAPERHPGSFSPCPDCKGSGFRSVQLPPHSIGQRTPGFRQAVDLLGFDRVIDGDALEQCDFIGHHRKVSNRPLPCPGHIGVSVQGLAAEDYSLIGFGWGHGGTLCR